MIYIYIYIHHVYIDYKDVVIMTAAVTIIVGIISLINATIVNTHVCFVGYMYIYMCIYLLYCRLPIPPCDSQRPTERQTRTQVNMIPVPYA